MPKQGSDTEGSNEFHPEDRPSKIKGLIWVEIACGFGILFAVGLSPLAHIIPWSWEKHLGEALRVELPGRGCKADPIADALLQKIVQRLYPVEPDDKSFPIEVHLVSDPVINAYAGLGGVITLNSGLLNKAESPEEIAGVLAHEMEHVHHRHIMEGAIEHFFTAEGLELILGNGSAAAGFAKYLLNMDFTKSQERQADEEGLKRLQAAHVDNQGFKHFFERMEKEMHGSPFLSDHPSNEERIEMVGRFQNQDTRPILTKDEWEQLKGYCQIR